MTSNEYKVSFEGDEIVLELIVMMVLYLCEYTKHIELYIFQ